MLKIAICDDQSNDLASIQCAAASYFSKHNQMAQFFCFDCSRDLLDRVKCNTHYDIILLDICMPDVSGTDIATEIRRRNEPTEIIFLSTSSDYAVEAFSLNATHYLTKPYVQQSVDESLDRALLSIKNRHQSTITLKLVGGGIQIINLNDIIYIESFNHEQKVCLKDNCAILARNSLATIFDDLNALSKGQFISPYKGYIINLKSVITIQTSLVTLQENQTVPISKRNYREVHRRYFAFMFDHQ